MDGEEKNEKWSLVVYCVRVFWLILFCLFEGSYRDLDMCMHFMG